MTKTSTGCHKTLISPIVSIALLRTGVGKLNLSLEILYVCLWSNLFSSLNLKKLSVLEQAVNGNKR